MNCVTSALAWPWPLLSLGTRDDRSTDTRDDRSTDTARDQFHMARRSQVYTHADGRETRIRSQREMEKRWQRSEENKKEQREELFAELGSRITLPNYQREIGETSSSSNPPPEKRNPGDPALDDPTRGDPPLDDPTRGNPPLEPESKLCNPNDACSGALPTLEDVLDEVHASIQEMMKSLKRKRHSGSLEARGAMWLLERVNGVIHQAREKIKQVEQHDIMKKYFRQQFAEMEQKQKLLSQQLEIKLLSVSQRNEKLLSQLLSQQK